MNLISSDQLVQQLVSSPQFEMVLAKVEDRARTAVVAETQKNAGPLIALALAGGCIGGYLFKGKAGAVVAAVVAVWAGSMLLNPGSVDAAMSTEPVSGWR